MKVTQYYANAWQFIIRLMMGFGMYAVLRIILFAFLTKGQGIAFTFGDSIAELFILLVTSILLLFFIWIKGTRSHLAAAIWMPAIACLAFSDLIRMILIMTQNYTSDAIFGILPFVLPLILMVLYWIFDPEILWLKLIATILFLGMTIFWITDVPKSFDEARNVQSVVRDYQDFANQLNKDRIVSWDNVPESLESGKVQSLWHTKPVDPLDYKIDEEIKGIKNMSYVVETDIIVNGVKDNARITEQDLNYETLDQISLHYFYKYVTTFTVVIKDFQYTGDAFFLLELDNGSKIIVDNVLIRKK